ncbi:HAD family hydrolase [Lysobacter korlensis]|uniref:HAD family hydrolase n=1 Tax=Lysobacter korlensis TaxID=553636 RepID=A0ABV6S0Y5_9GAMM
MSETSPIVVFDFDLTLTKWDTAERFFRWLLKRDPWRLALVAVALPVLAATILFTRRRTWLVRFAVWVATLGRGPAALPGLIEQHVQSFPDGPGSVFVPAAVERLNAHLAQGHRVVIATGCLEPLAQALLRHGGLSHVPLAASTVRPFLGGLVRDQHCFGPNKVPILKARGFAPPWAVAYTDHHADLPVLKLSAECYLVSPKPECLALIKQALATEATILTWR